MCLGDSDKCTHHDEYIDTDSTKREGKGFDKNDKKSECCRSDTKISKEKIWSGKFWTKMSKESLSENREEKVRYEKSEYRKREE